MIYKGDLPDNGISQNICHSLLLQLLEELEELFAPFASLELDVDAFVQHDRVLADQLDDVVFNFDELRGEDLPGEFREHVGPVQVLRAVEEVVDRDNIATSNVAIDPHLLIGFEPLQSQEAQIVARDRITLEVLVKFQNVQLLAFDLGGQAACQLLRQYMLEAKHLREQCLGLLLVLLSHRLLRLEVDRAGPVGLLVRLGVGRDASLHHLVALGLHLADGCHKLVQVSGEPLVQDEAVMRLDKELQLQDVAILLQGGPRLRAVLRDAVVVLRELVEQAGGEFVGLGDLVNEQTGALD